jgi:ligand-binding sensor domain-containing protein/signal transduction histidine kinase
MIPWVLALLVGTGLPQPSRSGPAQYIARAWGTGDGLPQNTVTSIVQTRDGYLWLGTFGGLVRFDGHAFTVFDPENTPGLASARIVTLHEDRTGVLWIGTEAGLTRYEGGRFTTFTTRDGLPYREIASIFDDSRGRLWIGTGVGIVVFDGRAFTPVPLGGKPAFARAMAETNGGDLWIATSGGLARIRHGDQSLSFLTQASDARALRADSRGRLWIGSLGKVLRWDPDAPDGPLIEIPLPGAAGGNDWVVSLAEDRDGAIWIGTTRSGLYFWRDGEIAAFNTAHGLTNDFVRAAAVDRDGNVWVGTDVGGLNRLKRRRVFSYQRPASAEQSIGPIVGDGGDGVWIGATCGGLLHFADGAFEAVHVSGLSNCVWSLHRDDDGTLWVGSMGSGLLRFSGGRFTPYPRSEPSDNLVTAITRDRDGTLWVGSDAGLSRFDGVRFTDVGRRDGLAQRVLCITQDRQRALWIGTIGGLFRIAGGEITHFTRKDGLSHDLVRAVHEDADGVLWIGTYGGGLNRLKDGRFVPFGPKAGLPDTAVSRIIEDDRGHLWMSGNRGIVRVARADLNAFADGRLAYVPSTTFGTADGMLTDETNGGAPAGWRAPDGRLWFPTIKGLVAIEPDWSAPTPPPVFVEGVLAGGRPIGAADSAGRGSADVELRYTAVDLGAAEKTRFRYRLVGYDRDWTEAGDRRVAFYTQVPPGRYTFEVIAASGDGLWSAAPARVAITIVPFWWQRREAAVAGVFLLIGITAFIARHVSLRRARARVAELERDQALERERARIARDLHDDLGSRLAQIALIAEGPGGSSPHRIATVAREAMQTMDELVWTVNSRNDTVERFAEFAAEFAEEHLSLAGIRYRLQIQPDLDGRRLDADARRHLFLAFKEAMHNVVKHAGASDVRIALHLSGDTLVLEVADNGRGLAAAAAAGTGNGLRNMRERLELAGGTLTVEPNPGGGTRLVFRAPAARGPAVV